MQLFCNPDHRDRTVPPATRLGSAGQAPMPPLSEYVDAERFSA
jgi:hypothetical protein